MHHPNDWYCSTVANMATNVSPYVELTAELMNMDRLILQTEFLPLLAVGQVFEALTECEAHIYASTVGNNSNRIPIDS